MAEQRGLDKNREKANTISCPNVKRECLGHCWHSVPHDQVSMCTAGVCPITFKKCICNEKPSGINYRKNLRIEGAMKYNPR